MWRHFCGSIFRNTASVSGSVLSYYWVGNSSVQCEIKKEQPSSPTKYDEGIPTNNKEDKQKNESYLPQQTFRERRLTLKNSPSNKDITIYPTEIRDNRINSGAGLIQGNYQAKSTFTIDNASSITPFSPQKVAIYSCHGVEPYFIEQYDEDGMLSNIITKTVNLFSPNSTALVDRVERQSTIIQTTKKKINQDRAHVVKPYGKHNETALFGVYDGHGERGEQIAEYTMNSLSRKLKSHPQYYFEERTIMGLKADVNNCRIAHAFRDVFREIDDEVGMQFNVDSKYSGSTACVALLRDNMLWIASVGDSRAVMARQSQDIQNHTNNNKISFELNAINLTKDQTAKDQHERKRIEELGGYITIPHDKTLPTRVWLNPQCSVGGLAMSRSIGDHLFKNVGVIAEPVVEKYEVKEEDEFLIIGSDGVWEFVSSAEAVHIIQNCFDDGLSASEACQELIRVSIQKWKDQEGDYRDDITAIVVRLRNIWDRDSNATS